MKYSETAVAILLTMLSAASMAVAQDAKTPPDYLFTTESLVKIIGGIIAAGAAILATFKALAEWRRSTKQRAEELNQRVEELELRQLQFRHKQALFARDLISEVFKDSKSRAALRMLDWEEFDYEDETGKTYKVSQTEIKEAMNPNLAANKKQAFIRTRFEALYDHLEQIERLISLKVLNCADVRTPFRYYIRNALHPAIRHMKFLDYFDYPDAKAFLSRFEKDKKAHESPNMKQ